MSDIDELLSDDSDDGLIEDAEGLIAALSLDELREELEADIFDYDVADGDPDITPLALLDDVDELMDVVDAYYETGGIDNLFGRLMDVNAKLLQLLELRTKVLEHYRARLRSQATAIQEYQVELNETTGCMAEMDMTRRHTQLRCNALWRDLHRVPKMVRFFYGCEN